MLTDCDSSPCDIDLVVENEKNEIEEKMFLEVHEALQAVYSPANVPQYEVNTTTIKILHQVLTNLKLKEKFNIKREKYYKNAAALYVAKSEDLQESLESLQLSLENFPQPCLKAVKALAASASVLELKDPTPTNFLLALNNLGRNQFEVSEEERKLVQQQAKLIKKYHTMLNKIDTLQKDVVLSKEKQESYSAEISKQTMKASFIKSKKNEYKQTERALQEKLEKCGYNQSINHSELVKKHKEILKLEEELNVVTKKLNSYHCLPPDESLAKLKVEEASQELLAIEEEIQKIIELRMQ